MRLVAFVTLAAAARCSRRLLSHGPRERRRTASSGRTSRGLLTSCASIRSPSAPRGLFWPAGRIVALYRLKATTLAVVDPDARTVTRRWRFRGSIGGARAAAGRVVLLEWPAKAPGPSTLHVLEPDNRLRSVRLERIAAGVQQKAGTVVQIDQPGLAIDDMGTRAFVVDRDGEICEVALDTLVIACHPLRATSRGSGASYGGSVPTRSR